tara:strand:+ start:1879 stop:3852 length:1974 start_codon:yes stop_codon:yes gene_type:complete
MTSKSLLTLIHFTLLFIIGLLFTIFLYKIKNAIFIEKFGWIDSAIKGIKILENNRAPRWNSVPADFNNLDFNLEFNPMNWVPPGARARQAPQGARAIRDFTSLYYNIIYGNEDDWDNIITSQDADTVNLAGTKIRSDIQNRAKNDFKKLSDYSKIIMVHKFYDKYSYYPTKDFRDSDSPYYDSDDNIKYVFSDIWDSFTKNPDDCQSSGKQYTNCYKTKLDPPRHWQYMKKADCCMVFGPWAYGIWDPRNIDNQRAYQLYMGLYEGLAEFLSEFGATTQNNAKPTIELINFNIFSESFKNVFNKFFEDKNLKNLFDELVSIITTTSVRGNTQTRFNWRPVMFKILKETNETDKETLRTSVYSDSTAWKDWHKAVFIHLKGWTSEPHEIVDTIKIKDNTKKDDIYLIDNNSIVVVLTTTTKPYLEYHHQINNIFENRYKLEIEGEEDKIFDDKNFDNKIFRYTFPDDLKNGKYKLKISVENNAGNSEAKSIDIYREPPVDCKGITLPCSTACETGSNRFIVTREPTGTGSPCPVISDCRTGSGLCGSTVGPNVLGVKTKAELEAVKKFEYPWIGSLMTWDEKIGSKIGSDLEKKLKKRRDIKINLNDNSNLCEDGSGVHELGGSWQYKCDSTGSTGSLIKISNFKNKINGIFSYSTVN